MARYGKSGEFISRLFLDWSRVMILFWQHAGRPSSQLYQWWLESQDCLLAGAKIQLWLVWPSIWNTLPEMDILLRSWALGIQTTGFYAWRHCFSASCKSCLGFCLCARWWFGGGSWYDVESVAGLKKPTNWQLIEFSEVWQESYDNLVAVLNAGIDDMDSGSINRLTSYGHRIPTRDDLNWLVTHMTGETPPNEDAEYYHINSTNRTDGKQACKGRACDQSSGKGPRFQGGKGVVLIESNHETRGIASVEGHASTAYCKVLVCRLEYLGVIVLSYRFHISSWVMPIQDFSYCVYSQFQYSQMDVGKDFATYTQTSGQNHLTRDLEEAHVPSSH